MEALNRHVRYKAMTAMRPDTTQIVGIEESRIPKSAISIFSSIAWIDFIPILCDGTPHISVLTFGGFAALR